MTTYTYNAQYRQQHVPLVLQVLSSVLQESFVDKITTGRGLACDMTVAL